MAKAYPRAWKFLDLMFFVGLAVTAGAAIWNVVQNPTPLNVATTGVGAMIAALLGAAVVDFRERTGP